MKKQLAGTTFDPGDVWNALIVQQTTTTRKEGLI